MTIVLWAVFIVSLVILIRKANQDDQDDEKPKRK